MMNAMIKERIGELISEGENMWTDYSNYSKSSSGIWKDPVALMKWLTS